MGTGKDLEYLLGVRDAALDYLDEASQGKLKLGYYNDDHVPVYKDSTNLAAVKLGRQMRLALQNDFQRSDGPGAACGLFSILLLG